MLPHHIDDSLKATAQARPFCSFILSCEHAAFPWMSIEPLHGFAENMKKQQSPTRYRFEAIALQYLANFL